jgi:hypothetical protein
MFTEALKYSLSLPVTRMAGPGMENKLEIEVEAEQPSNMSKFIEILVKLNYLPLKKEKDGKYRFQFWSIETLISFLLYVGCFIVLYFLFTWFFWISIPSPELVINTFGMTDSLTQFGFGILNFLLFPFIPLILGKAASQVPEISMDKHLPWPSIGWKVILCEAFTCLGYFLNMAPNYIHFGREAFKQNNISIYLSVMFAVIITTYIIFCFLLSQILIFSWLDFFGNLVDSCSVLDHARRCLDLYQKLDKALGTYFFFIFAAQQFAWIFSLYLSLSGLLNHDQELVNQVHGSLTLLAIKSGGMFLLSLCCLWHLFHMVSAVENLRNRYYFFVKIYSSLFVLRFSVLSKRLEEQVGNELTAREFYMLKQTVKRLENLNPFSANGFFSISRDTLRSMCSAAVTYLIILIQFRGGSPVTPRV